MMYMEMSGAGLLVGLIMAAIVIIPFWKLLPRFGIPAWVAIFAAFPLIALILLWVMAFRPGPDAAR